MVRLCRCFAACCAVAFASFGCTGQNIEGAWLGPIPIEDAKACRINIYSDHRFDVACDGLEWAGAGRYERDGNLLNLKFEAWVHRGKIQRQKPVLHLTFAGEGNTLRVGEVPSEAKPFVWHRASR